MNDQYGINPNWKLRKMTYPFGMIFIEAWSEARQKWIVTKRVYEVTQ